MMASVTTKRSIPVLMPQRGRRGPSLPDQFVVSMRTLFDILDRDASGLVPLQEIEKRWSDEAVPNLPGVLKSLRTVAPPDGRLSFETFVRGLNNAFLRARTGKGRNGLVLGNLTPSESGDLNKMAALSNCVDGKASSCMDAEGSVDRQDCDRVLDRQQSQLLKLKKKHRRSRSGPSMSALSFPACKQASLIGHTSGNPANLDCLTGIPTPKIDSNSGNFAKRGSLAADEGCNKDPASSQCVRSVLSERNHVITEPALHRQTSAGYSGILNRRCAQEVTKQDESASRPLDRGQNQDNAVSTAEEKSVEKSGKRDSDGGCNAVDRDNAGMKGDVGGASVFALVGSKPLDLKLSAEKEQVVELEEKFPRQLTTPLPPGRKRGKELNHCQVTDIRPRSLFTTKVQMNGAEAQVASHFATVDRRRRQRPKAQRRHTVANGVDYTLLSNIKKLDSEEQMLLHGLKLLDRGRSCLQRHIDDVERRRRTLNAIESRAVPTLSSVALDELASRIGDLESVLAAIVNVKVETPQQEFVKSPEWRERNKLTAEISSQARKIKKLEQEKLQLVQQLFQARTDLHPNSSTSPVTSIFI